MRVDPHGRHTGYSPVTHRVHTGHTLGHQAEHGEGNGVPAEGVVARKMWCANDLRRIYPRRQGAPIRFCTPSVPVSSTPRYSGMLRKALPTQGMAPFCLRYKNWSAPSCPGKWSKIANPTRKGWYLAISRPPFGKTVVRQWLASGKTPPRRRPRGGELRSLAYLCGRVGAPVPQWRRRGSAAQPVACAPGSSWWAQGADDPQQSSRECLAKALAGSGQ